LLKDKLQGKSFNDMVFILPEVYMLDDHLLPQWLKAKLEFRIWKFRVYIPIRTRKTFKLESNNNLQKLKEIFDIHIESKVNSTSSVGEDLIWTDENLKLIHHLYKRDFELFNYKIKTI